MATRIDAESQWPVDDLLQRARQGDARARERLVQNSLPFVLRVASRVCGRYLQPGIDDEISIGLIAFNEAIDDYDQAVAVPFLRFAETVIRRRLADYYRRIKNRPPALSWDRDAGAVTYEHVWDATSVFQRQEETVELREEIERFARMCRDYGLTFEHIARACPRHRDARARAQAVARLIVSNERFRDYLIRNRRLPAELVSHACGISRRTVDRNREYIMAVCLVLMGDFGHLAEYVCR